MEILHIINKTNLNIFQNAFQSQYFYRLDRRENVDRIPPFPTIIVQSHFYLYLIFRNLFRLSGFALQHSPFW